MVNELDVFIKNKQTNLLSIDDAKKISISYTCLPLRVHISSLVGMHTSALAGSWHAPLTRPYGIVYPRDLGLPVR